MSGRSWGKALFGGIIGLIQGVVVGADRVVGGFSDSVSSSGPGNVVWDINLFLRCSEFWFIVIVCTLVFAFIAGRIGRPTHHADL